MGESVAKCPVCGRELVKHENWGFEVCLNPDCPCHPVNNFLGETELEIKKLAKIIKGRV